MNIEFFLITINIKLHTHIYIIHILYRENNIFYFYLNITF